MARLTLLHFPDPRLRQIAAPVATVDASVRRLVDDMLETMYAAPGIGLAATQVNVPKRVLVIDVSDDKNQPLVLINPLLRESGGEGVYEEGCLSVPGFYARVPRASWVHVTGLDPQGQPLEVRAEGLLAVCLQHEMDHLQGKLFVDYLSALRRDRLRKKIEKQARDDAHTA